MDIEPYDDREICCSGEMEDNNDERKGTLLSSIAALFCTTMGVGVLGGAYGFAQTGYVFGAILYCIFCSCSALGLHLLSYCTLTCGSFPSSFYVVTHAAAPNWTTLIDSVVAVKCFLLATGILIVIGDNFTDALESIVGIEHYPSWLTIKIAIFGGVIMVIPLVCQRNFEILRYSSIVTAAFVVYMAVMVLLHAFGVLDPCHGKHTCRGDIIAASFSPSRVLPVLSLFVLNFTCQHNMFTACNELRGLSLSRLNYIIVMTMGLSLLSYLILGLGVYWTFGSYTLPDFLRNYPLESPYVGFARLGLSISMLMGYPMQVLPCRRSSISLIQVIRIRLSRYLPLIVEDGEGGAEYSLMEMSEPLDDVSDRNDETTTTHAKEKEEGHFGVNDEELTDTELMPGKVVAFPAVSPDSAGLFLFSAVTACIVVLSFFLATSKAELRLVLELAGAIGSTSITYIIPGFLYMRLHTTWNLRRLAALFLLTAGCLIVPICIVFIILQEEHME